MKKVLLTIIMACQVMSLSARKSVDYIDPMIGTDALGHTTPCATTPFGMVQLGPSMNIEPWDWKRCSGYHYDDEFIMGFSHNHISGAGLGALGDILFMPMNGDLKTVPGTFEHPEEGYISRFSHDEEFASAGFYSVRLADYGINVELTASPRTGFHRYTPESEGRMHVVIDPIHGITEANYSGEVEILSDTEVRGWKHCTGLAGDRKTYFYAKFSKPFDAYGTADGPVISSGNRKGAGNHVKAFVSFDLKKNENVDIAVAISHVSPEGALANFKAEARDRTFNQIRRQARQMWQEKCDKFDISGTASQKRIFYTSVYHSFISPNLISDVTGDYFAYGKVRHSDIAQYSNYSTWDTYRATHPLYTLVEHQGTADFVNSLTSRYTDLGMYLPVWECNGNDCICMIGRSPVAVMAEAIVKDIPGIDVEKAYEAMRVSILATDRSDWWYGTEKSGLDIYKDKGYITANRRTSVSKTLEFNYYDHAMAQTAQKLGKAEDAAFFTERSLGYRVLWNPEKKLMWPVDENGEFVTLDLTKWDSLNPHFVSGNIWGYSTYTPHDMDYMISKLGGNENYVQWLDSIFADDSKMEGNQILDISGFIGKYGHGDEPSHQMAYLYALAGAPEKTQELVSKISNEMYSDKVDGLVNNDDLGQMSSWYILSSFGFYPVNPVSGEYVLGRPLYKHAEMHFENGKKLIVEAKNWKPGSYLVDTVTFNGKCVENNIIKHSSIIQGGKLVFVMK